MREPTCGKCGGVMTPENARHSPELFLHDRCLPPELQPPQLPSGWDTLPEAEKERLGRVVAITLERESYYISASKPEVCRAVARAVWEASR